MRAREHALLCCVGTRVTAQVWGPENTLVESVIAFCLYVGHGDRTRVVRLQGKPLCLLSHLARPISIFIRLNYILSWVFS